MAKKIIWTRKARSKFNDTVCYLEETWGSKVAENYVKRCFSLIHVIADHPDIGSVEHPQKGIRGFLITKHDRLFYRVTEAEIILLNFFDTRSNPSKKPY